MARRHIHDLKNGSHRSIFEFCLGNLFSQLIIFRVLVKRSATVFYNEAVTTFLQSSVIAVVQFNLDNKYNATGGIGESGGVIDAAEVSFTSWIVSISL